MTNITALRQPVPINEFKLSRVQHSIQAIADMLCPQSTDDEDLSLVKKEDLSNLLDLISEQLTEVTEAAL